MPMKKQYLILICTALLFSACDASQNPVENTDMLTSEPAETVQAISEGTDLTEAPDEGTLSADFAFPITDGSTSTTNLDNAVRSAVLGGEQSVVHTKTYDSFYRLLNGECELIFTTPLDLVPEP